ncbi:ATP-dependent DNA ligase [Paraconexibacter sp. AEG42_29]|uniref:ATP-dependent DNA ligase n=2 Tax=Paraconexibacter sp. AEG42_29 TaxID=2997339 RepID=A0AAU7AXC0_9ACTN
MLSSPGTAVPLQDGWCLEPKWDGWRCLVTERHGRAAAYSRHGTAITTWLPADMRSALADVAAGGTVVDGELVKLTAAAAGPVADFAGLCRCLDSRHGDAAGLHLVVFDLLEHHGADVRQLPWRERRARLRKHLLQRATPDGIVSLISELPVSQAAHDHAVSLGLEGTIAKRASSAYRAGRSRSWLKLKARHEHPGVVLELVDHDRGPRALIALDAGGQSWATARKHVTPGQHVTVICSRRDADGSLREARIAPAGRKSEPAGAAPSRQARV